MGRFLFLFLVLLTCMSNLHAQFTIPTIESTQAKVAPMSDSLRPSSIKNNYFSRARWEAERRALRKQRNTVEFNASVTAVQNQFVNWQPGGENTFSARTTIGFRHQYKREKFNLEYRLDARYGMNYIDTTLFKNEDEFKVNAQIGWKMYRCWSYATTFNLRSQFSEGKMSRTNKTVVSDFMAPGYLDMSIGFNWKKQGSPWDITISPIGGKVTMVLNKKLSETRSVAGVPRGDKTKGQLGPSAQIYFDKTFAKKVIRYKFNFYSFTNLKTTPTARWENNVEIKATKLLTTKLYWVLNYDKSTRNYSTQYNYSISVGLAYTLKNK